MTASALTTVAAGTPSLSVAEMESFGAALRRQRNERGLSLRKLAALIPIDFGLLSKIENGLRPATPAVAAAADKGIGGERSTSRTVSS